MAIREIEVLIPVRVEGKHCAAGTVLEVDEPTFKILSRRKRRGEPFVRVIVEDVNAVDEEPEPATEEKPAPKKPAPKKRRRPPKKAASGNG